MSSWSAPVYPRRSRSRSPYRGGYPGRPPYPDPYGDPYRQEWDAYDRERWAGYERERGPYDYGRRGRSRSPDDGMPFRFHHSTHFAVASWSALICLFLQEPAENVGGRHLRGTVIDTSRDPGMKTMVCSQFTRQRGVPTRHFL